MEQDIINAIAGKYAYKIMNETGNHDCGGCARNGFLEGAECMRIEMQKSSKGSIFNEQEHMDIMKDINKKVDIMISIITTPDKSHHKK